MIMIFFTTRKLSVWIALITFQLLLNDVQITAEFKYRCAHGKLSVNSSTEIDFNYSLYERVWGLCCRLPARRFRISV